MGIRGGTFDPRFNIYIWEAKCSMCDWRKEHTSQSFEAVMRNVSFEHSEHYDIAIKKIKLLSAGSELRDAD